MYARAQVECLGMSSVSSLFRHQRVTCDLLESHTGTTITNTLHLLGEESRERVGERVRGPRREEEEAGSCQSRHIDGLVTQFCLFVCARVCRSQIFDGSDDNNGGCSSSCALSGDPHLPFLCSSLHVHTKERRWAWLFLAVFLENSILKCSSKSENVETIWKMQK